jgi:cytochrome b involved in lipid metabolism
VREYTAAEVRTHNTASSCWSIINGDVYNLTTWIGQHPGGAAAIQALCGVDGTRSFNSKHEGSGDVMRQLVQFNIGRLKG